MNISPVAICIRSALQPHINHFHKIDYAGTHETTATQHDSRQPGDTLIDNLVDNIFEDIEAIIRRHHQPEIQKRERSEGTSGVTTTGKIEVGI
jgi:hypothetical protein